MTLEMRRTLARLPYAEKLRRVWQLIEFSRRFRVAKTPPSRLKTSARRMQEEAKAFEEKEADV
jgi:hypothetical protein